MKKHFIAVCVLASLGVFAQGDDKDKKQVGSVEINVIDSYKASVKQAVKISRQPDFKDTVTKKLPVNYSIRSQSLDFHYNPKAIPAAKIKRTRLPKLPQNLITLGFGTGLTPLAEIYTGSSRNKNSGWGAHAKYFSTQGGVNGIIYDKASYRESEIDLYYKHIYKKYRIVADLDANFDKSSYYGMMTDALPEGYTDELEFRNYNRFGGQFLIENINSKSRAVFRSAAVNYHYLMDNYNTTEHTLDIPTKWLFKVQDEDIYTDLKVNYQKSAFGIDSINMLAGDTGTSPSFLQVQFMPKIKSNVGRLFFTVGLNINTNSETRTFTNPTGKTRVYFFPELTADIAIVPSVLAAYAGWTGSLTNNSIWSLKNENPYINTFTNMQATSENRIYAGVKGKITNNLVYNVQAKYLLVDNMALFYRSPLTYASSKGFEVLYDDAQVISLFGEVKLETSIALDIAGFFQYDSYNMKNYAHAYHMPNLKTGIIATYNWKEKIVLTTNFAYVGERTAFDHSLFENGTTTEYPILKGYVDLRLGAEYRYNDDLSAFINVTNLLSQNYQTWYSYPTQQIRFLMGLTYRF
jgi:hypothetical protein